MPMLSRLMHYHPLGVHYFTSAHSEPVNYAFDSLTYLYSSSVDKKKCTKWHISLEFAMHTSLTPSFFILK